MKTIMENILEEVKWFFEDVIDCYKYAFTHREWLPSLILSHVALLLSLLSIIVLSCVANWWWRWRSQPQKQYQQKAFACAARIGSHSRREVQIQAPLLLHHQIYSQKKSGIWWGSAPEAEGNPLYRIRAKQYWAVSSGLYSGKSSPDVLLNSN